MVQVPSGELRESHRNRLFVPCWHYTTKVCSDRGGRTRSIQREIRAKKGHLKLRFMTYAWGKIHLTWDRSESHLKTPSTGRVHPWPVSPKPWQLSRQQTCNLHSLFDANVEENNCRCVLAGSIEDKRFKRYRHD
jgi:hypothetical protein